MEERYQAYPEYKNSGVEWIREVPKHWGVAELKRYAYVQGGYAFDSRLFLDSGEPVIRIGDINQDGSVSLNNCKCVSSTIAEKYSQFIVKNGELVMAMTGATIGKAGWYKEEDPALVNQRVGVYKCTQSKLDYRYMWFVLNSSGYQEHIRLTAFGGAQPNISDAGMVAYKTTIPNIEEQTKIANFLDHETAKIDTLIEKQQKLIALLMEKRQAVISHAVTKGLNPDAQMRDSGVEWLGEVPEHWDIKYSKWLFLERNIKALEQDEMLTASQKYGVIFQKEFMRLEQQKVVQVQKGHNILKHVEPHNFVISMRSFQGGIEYCPYKGAVSSAYVPLEPVEGICLFYFKHLFKCSPYIQALQSTTNLVRDGQALRYSNFTQVWLPTPPIREQEQIAKYLDQQSVKIDKLVSKAEDFIKLSNERRTALISAAVTGKIDVRNWQSPITPQNSPENQ